MTHIFKSEDRIQQEIFVWYQNNYCLPIHNPRCMILHIPNEGKPDLVRIGLYPGAADLLVIHKHPEWLQPVWFFFEVKTETGTQSPNQKKFEGHCNQMSVNYYLGRSLSDFQQLITQICTYHQNSV